ncbi:MAG: FimV/HubP family polar landmark protein [Methylophilaceae bacterium]
MRDTTLKNSLLALYFVLISTVAQAAKLGDITVLSTQGQPLNAEIALFPVNQEELAGITARIASAEVFAEQGVTRAPELDAVRAVVGVRADGQPIVQLFSAAPMSASALDMLIQVDSSTGGSLVRKYALALEAAPAAAAPTEVALPAEAEPPAVEALAMAPEAAMAEAEPTMEVAPEEAMIEEAAPEEVMEEREATIEEMTADVSGIEAPEDTPVIEADEAVDMAVDDMQAEDMTEPLADEPEEIMAETTDDMATDDMQAQDMTEVDEIESEMAEEAVEPEPTPEQLAAMTAEEFNPENPVEAPPAPAFNVTVGKGDTLRKIATQHWQDDVSLEQMMAGIYRANPQAFKKGNPERMKVGEIVRVPSADDLKSIDQAEAESFVHAKNWNAYRDKLSDTVARSAPVKDSASSAVASGKIATVRDQAEAAHEPRDVVKLSGDAGKATGSKMSKAAMEEELAARENALKESNDRISLLEKQLADANALLEAQKKAVEAAAAIPSAESAKEAAKEQAKPKGSMMATLQENLQKHPDWKAKGLGALAILVALGLILRNRRKEGGIPKKPDAPTAETSGAALTELSPEAAAEKVAADIAAGAAIGAAALAAGAATQQTPELVAETTADADDVLSVADLDALLPDDEPAAEPTPAEPEVAEQELTMAEAMEQEMVQMEEPVPQEPSPQEPDQQEPSSQEPSADELVADMMAASDAAKPMAALAPVEPEAAGDEFDDVFNSEAALAEMVAEMPASAAPAAVDEMADEAATDMMAATAMEDGSVEADDQFALDDVFADAAVLEVTPAAEAADELDDIFGSEAALAEAIAEMPEASTPMDEAAAAMADEAATDMMAATAMEDGSVEADDQFALDDVFAEAAPVVEAPPAIAEMPASNGDHSAALAAAFEETANEDLSGLDFDFVAEMPEEAAAVVAPVAKTRTKKATKPKAKKAAADPEVRLDLVGIDLDVTGDSAVADSAEVETKLDLVSAYMDMGDEDGAREILQEVAKEGSAAQIAKAQKLLNDLG